MSIGVDGDAITILPKFLVVMEKTNRSTDVWVTRRLGDRFLDNHLGTGVGRLGDSNWPL